MKKYFVFLVALSCTIGFLPNRAEARVKFGLMGSYGISKLRTREGTGSSTIILGDTKNSYNIGGGVILDIGMLGPMSFELGSIYQRRGFKDSSSNDEVKFNTLISTAIIRYNFKGKGGGKKVPVSVGLGGYYSGALDSKVTLINGITGAETETSFTDSSLPLGAMTGYDHGVIASFTVDVVMGKGAALTLDFRYLLGAAQPLSNNPDALKANWHEVSTLAGFTFAF